MVERLEVIHSHFASNHIRLRAEWLREVVNFLSNAKRITGDLLHLIYHQWLFSNIVKSTEPVMELENANIRELSRPCVFQIQSVSDVGTPRLKQFQKLVQADYDEDSSGVGVVEEFESLNPEKGYKCFCLRITDGKRQFNAIEKKRVPDLALNTAPGSKIVIFAGAKIRCGVVLLAANNCQVLGGAVSELLKSNNALKLLSEQLNKPLPSKTLTAAKATTDKDGDVQKPLLPPPPSLFAANNPQQQQKHPSIAAAPSNSLLFLNQQQHTPPNNPPQWQNPKRQQQQNPAPLPPPAAPSHSSQWAVQHNPPPILLETPPRVSNPPARQFSFDLFNSPFHVAVNGGGGGGSVALKSPRIEGEFFLPQNHQHLQRITQNNDDGAERFGRIVADFLRKFGSRKQIQIQMEFQQLMLKYLPEDE